MLCQLGELLNRCGAVDVDTAQKYLLFFAFLQKTGQFPGCGCLARTLQSREQNHGGRARSQIQSLTLGAHEGDQFIMDDFNDRLTGAEAPQHGLTYRFFPNTLEETAHHRQCHIGLQQGNAHFAQCIPDVLFAKAAASG